MNDQLPRPGLPLADSIDVWRINLNAASDLPFETLLTDEERLRAEKFLEQRHASRFRAGRAVLRLGLARYLCLRPDEVKLENGLHGKPRLAGGGQLQFNVTHSGALALMAFTRMGDVGIDVEAIREDVEGLDIASTYFTANETATITAAMPAEQCYRFFQLWVRKEAILKASGRGISDELDSFDVSDPGKFVRLKEIDGKFKESVWVVHDLDSLDGYAAAIAAPAGEWRVNRWSLDDKRAMQHLFTSVGSG